MAINLDNEATRKKYDAEGMLTWVEEFVEQCKHAEKLARDFKLPQYKGIQNIVLCGMGGSAIGGDLLRAYAVDQVPVPFEIAQQHSRIAPRTIHTRHGLLRLLPPGRAVL